MVTSFRGSDTHCEPDRQVLVVDDDEGARDTFALLFKSEGFHPIVVGDVPSAQRLVSAGSFSLIVLDLYWQSEPQGLELLEVLSRERRPDPVVVVTGFASVGITVQAMRLGALTVLEKPVDSVTLLGIAHRGQSAASPPQTPNEIFGRLRSEHLDLPAFLEIAAVCRMHATGKMIRADHVCRRPSGARTRRFMQLLDEGTTAALIKTEAAWGRYLLIDPAHFGRLLQAETGVGFRVWRRAARVRRAVNLLMASELTIGQIAARVGCDQSQLSREFREPLGVRPLQFRNWVHDAGRKPY